MSPYARFYIHVYNYKIVFLRGFGVNDKVIWTVAEGTRSLNVRVHVFVDEFANIPRSNINHFRQI